jgi:hypothetical protein
MRAFGRLHAGNYRRLEHRTLAGAVPGGAQGTGYSERQAHPGLSDGDAVRYLFRSDVHHCRLAARVEVCEAAPRHQPPI